VQFIREHLIQEGELLRSAYVNEQGEIVQMYVQRKSKEGKNMDM
jgi:hypothetical protein